jgi:hypothetical protein
MQLNRPAPSGQDPPIHRFVDALRAKGSAPTATRNGFQAKCPVHGGRHFDSLSVAEGHDGRVLLCCHSKGCPAREIVAALGLELRDLFAHRRSR